MTYLIWSDEQVHAYADSMVKALDASLRREHLHPLGVKPRLAREVYVEQMRRYALERGKKIDLSLLNMLREGGRLSIAFDRKWKAHQQKLEETQDIPTLPMVQSMKNHKPRKRVF